MKEDLKLKIFKESTDFGAWTHQIQGGTVFFQFRDFEKATLFKQHLKERYSLECKSYSQDEDVIIELVTI